MKVRVRLRKAQHILINVFENMRRYGSLFDSTSQIEEAIGNTVDAVEKMPQPRFIRSHLPLGLLPKQVAEKKPKVRLVYKSLRYVRADYIIYQ